MGLDLIRAGRARCVLAGGTEALCRLTFGGFTALRAMDDRPCRPFHAERKGLTLGDGAAMLVLEEQERARARGVRPYAELAGYGVSADAHHLTAPPPDGRGAVAAMRAALRDAGVAAEQVQYINAHGTATLHNDPVEVAAIRATFGAHADRVAVSSTKAMTGHALGAAGALEATVCALAIREELVPPTLRLDRPDPACDLDLVPDTARRAELDVVLSNSFAFGGNNTTLVLRRVE
jgi:3-oxoacyl-[acyl-carrier-protein] synthase II